MEIITDIHVGDSKKELKLLSENDDVHSIVGG